MNHADDPLDRFADELRALRPRGPSGEARRYVADRLDAPSARRPRRNGLALRLSAAAAFAASAVTAGWVVSRPGPVDRPPAPVESWSAPMDVGCECRIRFLPRPPIRSASFPMPASGLASLTVDRWRL